MALIEMLRHTQIKAAIYAAEPLFERLHIVLAIRGFSEPRDSWDNLPYQAIRCNNSMISLPPWLAALALIG